MGLLGPDNPLWRVVDERIKKLIARRSAGVTQVQVLGVGAGLNAGKVKVRDPAGGTTRDLYYPQTDPSYVPGVGEWMWALEKEGGLLLLSPTGTVIPLVEWNDILNKPASFPSTWTTVSGKPATFAPDAHNFWSTKHPDVTSTDTPVDGDVVTYDGATSKWKAVSSGPDYVGSQQLIAASSSYTWTHSLGSRPRIINAYRRATSTATAYIPLPAGDSSTSGLGQITTAVTAVTTTQITIINLDTDGWYCGVELWV